MKNIVLAGKGSSGKSVLLPYLLNYLRGRYAPVLVVDADPHQTATRLLGTSATTTLGLLRSTYESERSRAGDEALWETRAEHAERLMGDMALAQENGYDFLAMGRWSEPGSQCTVNRTLERALTQIASRYNIVLTDNEAGLEHIGRFAYQIDVLLLVAQPDPLFLDVAAQIIQRAQETHRTIRALRLILNRVQEGDLEDEGVRAWLETLMALGAPLAVALPESPGLRTLVRQGQPLLDLPETDTWRSALTAALPQLLPINGNGNGNGNGSNGHAH